MKFSFATTDLLNPKQLFLLNIILNKSKTKTPAKQGCSTKERDGLFQNKIFQIIFQRGVAVVRIIDLLVVTN